MKRMDTGKLETLIAFVVLVAVIGLFIRFQLVDEPTLPEPTPIETPAVNEPTHPQPQGQP